MPTPTVYSRLKRRARRWIQSPVVEASIVLLIAASVVMIIWTTAFPPRRRLLEWLLWLEDLTTLIFIFELSVRFWVEPKKRHFFRLYWVDILAVLPILRVFRAFRVLRLLRILRILRLFRAGLILSRRLSDASQVFRQGLAHYFLMTVMVCLVVLFSALALHHFESSPDLHPAANVAAVQGGVGASAVMEALPPQALPQDLSFHDAFWWAIFSIVAGEPIDYSPKTTGGRVVLVLVMFSGLTVFAFITGVVSAFMVERLRMGVENQIVYPEDLDDHFVVLGWNLRAPLIIEELQADPEGRDRFTVVLADRDTPEEMEWLDINRNLVHFVRGDPVSPKDLERLNIPGAFSVVILSDTSGGRKDADRDARTVLCALMVEKLYPSCFTCAELINREHASHLKLAGVEEVVIANESSASVLAMATLHLDMTKILAELLSFKVGNQFYKIIVPESWDGKTFLDSFIEIKSSYNALVIGVCPRRTGIDPADRRVSTPRDIIINPESNSPLKMGDELLVIAQDKITLT